MADIKSNNKNIRKPLIAVLGVTKAESDVYFTPTEDRPIYESHYISAIEKANAKTILINPELTNAEILTAIDKADGLLLVGGRDIHSDYFNQPLHPKAKLVPQRRDEIDFLAFAHAKKNNIPTLGICRGAQVMAVGSGGSIHQHLPDVTTKVEHQNEEKKIRHDVMQIEKCDKINWPKKFNTNSYHHQAIDNPGSLCVIYKSEDGIIEACYEPSMRWALAIQWHPELIAEEPFQKQLFSKFISACSS